jgi:hypothetical protein
MTHKNSRTSAIAVLVGLSLWGSQADAAIVQIASPDAAYTSSTILLPITGTDGDTVNSISDANLTVTFSDPMQKFIGSWGTWGTPPAVETSTPNVMAPGGPNYQSVTSITMTFSTGLSIFGVEVQPDAFTQGFFPVSMEFLNGVTSLGVLNNSLDGSTAALFAASSTTPITSVILTIAGNVNLPDGTDPAIAQVRYALDVAAVPEPATLLTFASGFALLIGFRRLRSARN